MFFSVIQQQLTFDITLRFVSKEFIIVQLFSPTIINDSKLFPEGNKFLNNHANLVDFLENAPRPLHSVSETGKILWANKYELDILGYKPDEYIGHDIGEVSNIYIVTIYFSFLYK